MQVSFSAPSLAPSPFAGAAPADQAPGTTGESFASLLDSHGGRQAPAADPTPAAKPAPAGAAPLVSGPPAEVAPGASGVPVKEAMDTESLPAEGAEVLSDWGRPEGGPAVLGQRIPLPVVMPMFQPAPGATPAEQAVIAASAPEEVSVPEVPGKTPGLPARVELSPSSGSPVPESSRQVAGRVGGNGFATEASLAAPITPAGAETDERPAPPGATPRRERLDTQSAAPQEQAGVAAPLPAGPAVAAASNALASERLMAAAPRPAPAPAPEALPNGRAPAASTSAADAGASPDSFAPVASGGPAAVAAAAPTPVLTPAPVSQPVVPGEAQPLSTIPAPEAALPGGARFMKSDTMASLPSAGHVSSPAGFEAIPVPVAITSGAPSSGPAGQPELTVAPTVAAVVANSADLEQPAVGDAVTGNRVRMTPARRVIELARTAGVQINVQSSPVPPPHTASVSAGVSDGATAAASVARAPVSWQTLTQMLVETATATLARPAQTVAGQTTPGAAVPPAATATAEPMAVVQLAVTPVPVAPSGGAVVAVAVEAADPLSGRAPELDMVNARGTRLPPKAESGAVVDPAASVVTEDQPAETAVRGLREILAGSAGKTGHPEGAKRKENAEQNFQTVEKQRVGGQEAEFGTRSANRTQAMTASTPVSPSADAAPDLFAPQSAPLQALGAAGAATMLKQTAEVSAPQRSFAAAAVREMVEVAEKAQEAGRTHIELRLETKDNEGLRIHLNWRDGVVHAKFVAQTAELQRALSREWDEASPRFAERGLKFSEPSFERHGQQSEQQAGQQPGHTAFSSGQQRQYSRGRFAEADDLPGFALPGAASKAAATATRLQVSTRTSPSPVLADARGLRVWA